MTGPTGPTVTANNLEAGVVQGQGSRPIGGVIVLSTTVQNGTAITTANGQISLAPNQQYSVNYDVNATNPAGSGFNAIGVGLQLNGSTIQNSSVFMPEGGGTNISGGTIINTGAGANTLTLINLSQTVITPNGGNIRVVKLA